MTTWRGRSQASVGWANLRLGGRLVGAPDLILRPPAPPVLSLASESYGPVLNSVTRDLPSPHLGRLAGLLVYLPSETVCGCVLPPLSRTQAHSLET